MATDALTVLVSVRMMVNCDSFIWVMMSDWRIVDLMMSDRRSATGSISSRSLEPPSRLANVSRTSWTSVLLRRAYLLRNW